MTKQGTERLGNTYLRILVFFAVLMITASLSYGDDLTICPSKLILNAEGQFEDVQAVIRMPMDGGYALSDYSVSLLINDVTVSEAHYMWYCYIDQNFMAYFDRDALQANPDVIASAGGYSTATVEGWYTAVNADGDSYTREFSFSTLMEILKPGNK